MANGRSSTHRTRVWRDRWRWLFVPAILAALVAGCNFPVAGAATGLNGTAALETAVAELFTQESPQGTPLEGTAVSPLPETAPGPGSAGPTATPVATGCFDRASFVADVSVPDDTVVAPGAPFTKTWRLRNNGTCAWGAGYDLVFSGGDEMASPLAIPLGQAVPPGSEIELSVGLVAPDGLGVFRANWMLRNPQGRLFGIGPSGDLAFWVQIQVGTTATPPAGEALAYSFVEHVCQAEWRSAAGLLPCPGTETDPNGFVVVAENPRLENGALDDEPVIYTHPQWTVDGAISGRFPPILVPANAHLRTIIGCAWNARSCDLTFQINYRIGDGPLENLGQWSEVYDSRWRAVDVDLSFLAGQPVSFILANGANGPATQDRAYWLSPVILH